MNIPKWLSLPAVTVASILACGFLPTARASDDPAEGQGADKDALSPVAPSPDAYALELTGSGLRVSYEASKDPVMTVEEDGTTRTFRGADVVSVVTSAGTLVSVVTRATLDAGSTTLSLLVPRLSIRANATEPVHTQAIVTVHELSLPTPVGLGQLERYTFVPLAGTAAAVSKEAPL
jgi:hypothetical protein